MRRTRFRYADGVAPERTTADEQVAPPPKRRRLRRAFGTILATLGLSAVFAFSVLLSLGLHVNLPPLRRIAKHTVNRVLANTLEGRVVVEELDQLSLHEIKIRSVVAIDPLGRQTIRASGVTARVDLVGFAREFIDGNTMLTFPLVRIEDGEVLVSHGEDGHLGIARTFSPRARKPTTTPPKPKAAKPRKTAIAFERIEIGHAWVHGNVTAPRMLDGDVTQLVGSVRIGPDKLTVDVEPTQLVERGILPAQLTGNAEYHLHIDFATPNPSGPPVPPKPPRMWAGLSGQAGNIDLSARWSLDGSTTSASIELPRTEPADLVKLVPGLPIQERTSLRASIEGTHPTYDIDARLDVTPADKPPASVVVAGKLDARGGPKLVVDVTTTDLDARAFREDFPATSVDARARVHFSTNPSPRLVVDASVDPTELEGQPVPAIDAHAVFDHGMLEGRVTLHEPGAPTQGSFVIEGRDLIRFEAESNIASLQAMPRLGGPLSGSGRVRVRGVVRGGTELDARVAGTVHSLAAKGSVSLEDGRIDGHLRGPFNQLEMDALVTGERLRAGENAADRVTVRARGPVTTPSIDAHLEGGDIEDLRASARVDSKAKAVRNVELRLSRGGEELHGKVAEVRAERGSVAARGLSLEGPGLGALGGTLVVANQEITGNLTGKGIDLSRLGRLIGVGKRTRGIADVDVSLARTKRGRKGHVRVQVKDATVSPMPGIELAGAAASVNATFNDEHASLEASVRLDDHAKPGEDPATACDGTIAEVRISAADATLKGPLLAASTWTKMTGRARVDALDTRLDCVAKRLPIALLLTEVGGRLDASLSVERPEGQRFVSVKSLDVRTRGLTIAGPQMFGEDKPRWESRSVDVAVTASLDGATGATAGKVVLSDTDKIGELSANVDLDLRTIVDDPKRRRESLAQSQGKLSFTMPRRSVKSLRSLPSFVHDKLPPFEGDLAVTATASGTLVDPTMSARVSAWRWAHVDEKGVPTEWSLPVDADVVASYKAKKAGVVAQLRRNGREIASVVGDAAVDVPALLRGGESPAANFDAQATLTRLPIGRLPYVAARGVDASVSGTIRLAQQGDERTARAQLYVPALRINNEVSLERAALLLDIVPSTDAKAASHGTLDIELAGREGGRVDVKAYAGVNWDGFVPKIDDLKAAGMSIVAHSFRLASLQPMVNGVFSRLDGRLDGHVHVASTMYGDESQGHVEANMELVDGVVHIPQIGQELKNAHFSLRSRERGALQLDDIQAEGISGRIHGSAVARMKGLSFRTATADFSIRESEALPITFEGVPLGQAYGNLSLVAEKRPQEVHLAVTIPQMHLALPASSSRAVQSLEPHPDIVISHPVGKKKEARQSGALAWITTVELGTLHIEGTGIDVKLTSPKGASPRIELREEARVSGDVQLVKGTVEVIGKKFEIERGLLRLREEEAGNPYVNLTARWDAPNGSRVYVDYSGVLKPITEQKLRFRSDPPMPQQHIFSMILTGETPDSTDDTSTEGSASAADVAANVVGGEIASTQINAMLSQIAPLRGLSTRVGTSDSGRLRTTVMYELGDTVTAQASYEGIPNGARLEGIRTQDPSDSTNRTEINIDWRFYRNWSLRGSFGFGGVNQQPSSGLDLLWQYRY